MIQPEEQGLPIDESSKEIDTIEIMPEEAKEEPASELVVVEELKEISTKEEVLEIEKVGASEIIVITDNEIAPQAEEEVEASSSINDSDEKEGPFSTQLFPESEWGRRSAIRKMHELQGNGNCTQAFDKLKEIADLGSDENIKKQAAFQLAIAFDSNVAELAFEKDEEKALNYYQQAYDLGAATELEMAKLCHRMGHFGDAHYWYTITKQPREFFEADAEWNEGLLYFLRNDTDYDEALRHFVASEMLGGADGLSDHHSKAFDEAVAKFLEKIGVFKFKINDEKLQRTMTFLYMLGARYLQEGPWKERGEKGWLMCKQNHKHEKSCWGYPYDLIRSAADAGDLFALHFLATSDTTDIPLLPRLPFFKSVATQLEKLPYAHKNTFHEALDRAVLTGGHFVPTVNKLRNLITENRSKPGHLEEKIASWEEASPPFYIYAFDDPSVPEALKNIVADPSFETLAEKYWCAGALKIAFQIFIDANEKSIQADARITKIEEGIKRLKALNDKYPNKPKSLLASAYKFLGTELCKKGLKKKSENAFKRAIKLGSVDAHLNYADQWYLKGDVEQAAQTLKPLVDREGEECQLRAIARLVDYYFAEIKNNKDNFNYYRALYDKKLAVQHIAHPVAKSSIDRVDEEIKRREKVRDEHCKNSCKGRVIETRPASSDAEKMASKMVKTFEKAQNALTNNKIVGAANALRDAVVNDGLLFIVDNASNTDSFWDQFQEIGKEIGEKSLTCSSKDKEEIDDYVREIAAAVSTYNEKKKRREKEAEDQRINTLKNNIQICRALDRTFKTYSEISENPQLGAEEKNKQLSHYTHKLIYPALKRIPELATPLRLLHPVSEDGVFSVEALNFLKSAINDYCDEQLQLLTTYDDELKLKLKEKETLATNMEILAEINSNENNE